MALSFDKVNKIITILSPDTEITIQNLLNSIREYEDELASMDIPKIVSCAGKEPLGGGVVVGLTLTLLDDWQLAFEARSGPTYIQCTVAGGNIVATNVNGSIYPTAFTQVLITASSSATQSDLEAIQYSSYGGGISLDIITGVSGTDYPIGNQEYPVNNLGNAITIANSKGFSTIYIRKSMTGADALDSGNVVSGFKLIGESMVATHLEIADSLVCDNLTIQNCNITGTLDGGTEIDDCVVGDLVFFNGHIHNSGLVGTITLAGTEKAVISDCKTIDQDNPPIIDMGGSGQSLALPNYSGIATITNLDDDTQEIGIGLNAGMVILTDTITSANSVVVAGNGILYDNSSVTVNTDGLMNTENISKAVWDEPISNHLIDGTTGLSIGVAQFNGVIAVSNTGVSGTIFPIGTERSPVNNITDAVTIAEANGIDRFYFGSDFTFGNTVYISNYILEGYSKDITLTCTIGSVLAYCKAKTCAVTGFGFGLTQFEDCILDNYSSSGLAPSSEDVFIVNSFIRSTCTLPSNYTGKVQVINCSSIGLVATNDSAIFDVGGAVCDVIFRGYAGGIRIQNATQINSNYSIDLSVGKVSLEASCTAGIFTIKGVGLIKDNSTGTTINVDGLVSKDIIAETISESYGERIYIDVVNGTAGTEVPQGNEKHPVDNLTDALTIAVRENVDRLDVAGALTITTGEDISGFTLIADRSLGNSVTVNSGATTSGTYFENLTISGDMTGSVRYTTCVIGTITGFDGGAKNSLMVGNLTFTGTNNNYLTECDTYVTTSGYTSIYQNDASLNIIRGRGRWGIFDKTSTNYTGIDLVAGFVYVDSTCNVGEVHIGGIGSVEDNSGDGCTVRQGAINNTYIASAVWDEHIDDHVLEGSIGHQMFYEAYEEKIYLSASGVSGQGELYGTKQYPFNNIADALVLLNTHDWNKIHVTGSVVISDGEDMSGIVFESDRSLGNSINVINAITNYTYFENLTVSGTMNGPVRYTTCVLGAITNFDGGAKNSLITDNITITGNGANYFTDCDTYISNGVVFKKLTINDKLVNIIRCRGNYEIASKTGDSVLAIDLFAGTVLIDSECTAGEILLDGILRPIDNSGNGCNVTLTNNLKSLITHIDKYIYIDTDLDNNGDGSISRPFNDTEKAIDFAEAVGWKKIIVLSDITLDRKFKNFTIEGVGLPTVDFNGQDVDRSEFLKVRLTGQQVGSVTCREVILLPGVSDLNGVYKESGIITGGVYTIAEGGAVSLVSSSALPDTGEAIAPTFDLGELTTTSSLILRKYSGSMIIKNVNTSTKLVTTQFAGGRVELQPSCSDGKITIHGLPDSAVTDESTGSTIIVIGNLPSAASNADVVWDEQISEHLDAGSTGSKLNTASAGGVDYNLLAEAIWDANIDDYNGIDTFGQIIGESSNDLKRVLGLLDENSYLDQQVYDVNNRLISARKRTYTDSTNTVVLATYQIIATWDSSELTSYRMVRV